VLSVMVDPASVNTLYPGDAVVLTGTTANAILVDKAVATDTPLGYVIFTPKLSSWTKNDVLEIAMPGTVINLEAASAITRGNSIEFVPTGSLVKTAAGVNPVSGLALDNAVNPGDLVRVLVMQPAVPNVTTGSAQITGGNINGTVIGGSTPAAGTFTKTNGAGGGFGLFALRTRVTLAQMNAGLDLLAAVAGLKYRLVNYKIIAIGANAAATANATGVAIKGVQSSSTVKLGVCVLAGLTRSTVNVATSANNTVLADGASFVACDANSKISVQADGGTDLITATAFDVIIDYAVES